MTSVPDHRLSFVVRAASSRAVNLGKPLRVRGGYEVGECENTKAVITVRNGACPT